MIWLLLITGGLGYWLGRADADIRAVMRELRR